MRTLSLLVLLSFSSSIGANTTEKTTDLRLSGGATTTFDKSINAFSLPANNMSISRRDQFFIGNAFFTQPWVSAPSSTTARDGLGPLLNSNSCQGCHTKDGRGQPPQSLEDTHFTSLIRLSIPPTTADHQLVIKTMGVVPEPSYGDQLQPLSIQGLKPEGKPVVNYETITGQFKDGTPYELLKPKISISQLNYGALHPNTLMSLRVAPVMVGMGLLEAIPESAILAFADPEDKNGDGISGRPNRVWDIQTQQTTLGRFGWKANQPTVKQQSAGAFHGDIGITSSLFPEQSCSTQQTDCLAAPDGGKPEISDEILNQVTFYASTLAVPARRKVTNPQVQHGQVIFNQSACASCHIPHYVTGKKAGFPELENQSIQPFTDLLLHDMGEGLADNRPDFEASGSEWRTAPLWGISRIEKVNGHTRFLHDGRARNLMEAVLWHGGEAEAAKQAVLALNPQERAALLAFLNSL
ncbi:di-heme oxidoredictase family protein [Thiofilum flexile]|uniref:di-heme oxidoreductase family protein n=1 Tax=Thiofilum flexile TaxID=125627 RepID=UPI00035DB838|nr:di-heme oxidoredictase family protein [Thiofilum flexile]